MADAYLERMGRELKCPICLSLLNSAVSLTCNHVFCNSCIEKSMKSASNCPVCKVPYRRREIRPAPHMDNLVNVYKSMEVASGINIFVTQNTASTKITGEANGIGNKYHEVQDNDKVQQGTLDEKYSKMGRRKGLKKASITNKRDCATNTRKPTFPTKKRVQVSLHPNSETQNPTEKLEQGAVSNEAQKNTILRTDISSICEKDEQNLSPFFWLREEEDIEKSSQQTDGNQIMYTPPEIPCFSDIKDSDDDEDDAFCKLSPKRGTCNQSDNADFFDSEMFDWTQRPCSPELCLSPQAMQIVEIGKHNGAHWVAEAALIDTTAGVKVNRKKREPKSLKEEPVNASKNKGYTRTSIKRVCNATEVRENKRTKKNMCPLAAVHSEMEKIASKNVQNNSGMKDKLLKLREQPGRTKKSCSEAVVQDLATENVPTQSDGLVPIGYSNEPAPIKFSPSENHGRSSDMAIKLNKRSKCSNSSKKAGAQQQILDGKVNDRKLEIQKVPDMVIRRRACEKDLNKVPKSLKKGKFSVEGIPEDNCNNILSRCNDVSAIRGQTSLELQDNRGQVETRIDPKLDKVTSTLNGSVLLKCKAPSVAVHCAFCQASEESEASGDMVHYLNGKRLDHSDKTISNAIHVHKNCAEWAPNVYFEDDTIVNIENEMSRSRRIRCSCCGLKGAALGCFEKSCRKSFHVPCARLTPECRWDYEHFVMLCPIHASCQLPNEVQKSQANQKRKSAVKSKTDTHQAKTNNGCKAHSTSQLGLQKRFKNVVLCYSALTITEKEIASEFEDLSGVAVLKNWDSTITHVIASTDENGACRRTLKFLMGVLEGKWILSVYWLKACIEAGALVDEQPYEVAVDIHGIRDGPRLGRLRLLDKQSKLFEGYKFFFMSDFAPSYKGYLQDLIIAAGGKVLTRKPVMEDQSNGSSSFSATTFIIYSLEIPDKCRQPDASSILNHRRAKAEALATSTGSMVASNSWILNCIAGQKLQDRGE